MNSSQLTVLVPTTAYTLAYTLPLLLLSILLIFAGSFLTLDRTRSFPPAEEYSSIPGLYEPKSKKRKLNWRLEGGLGGLAIGYTFGVHLSTLLALLIPGTTSSASLSPKSFLAVWILSCIPTTALGGFKRHAALAFAGIGGGLSMAIAFSVILHPSLLPRQILLGVFSILLTASLFVGLLIPRFSVILRPTLRMAASAMGALGLIISISLLSRPEPVLAWANSWERLWVKNGDPAHWGTGKEKGLSAAWAIFWVLGMAGDWALSRWVGECPDEKWDNYLAKYTSDPPNQPNRAGTFRPPKSFWDKLFPSKSNHGDTDLFLGVPSPLDKEKGDDIIFPSDKDMKRTPAHAPTKSSPADLVDTLYNVPPPKPISPKFKGFKKGNGSSPHVAIDMDDTDVEVPSGAEFLRKKTKATSRWKDMVGKRKKKPVRFGTIDELSSSDSSSDEAEAQTKGVLGQPAIAEVQGDAMKQGKKGSSAPVKRPWIITNHQPSYSSDTSNAPTLVDGQRSAPRTPSIPHARRTEEGAPDEYAMDIDYDRELQRLQARLGSREVLPVYSDDEVDAPITSRAAPAMRSASRRNSRSPSQSALVQSGAEPAWSPGFLQRHQSQIGVGPQEVVVPPIPGALPVPATPSLIRAVDRIVEAQQEVYGGAQAASEHPDTPGGSGRGSAPRWDEFWREVSVKAKA